MACNACPDIKQRALCRQLLRLQIYRNEAGLKELDPYRPLGGGGSVELGDKGGLNAVTPGPGPQRLLSD